MFPHLTKYAVFSLIQSYNLATHTAKQLGRMHFRNALKVAKLGFFVSRNAKRPRFKLNFEDNSSAVIHQMEGVSKRGPLMDLEPCAKNSASN